MTDCVVPGAVDTGGQQAAAGELGSYVSIVLVGEIAEVEEFLLYDREGWFQFGCAGGGLG
jgi:hypothetical protein